jgi:hypothetical protein
MMCVPSGTRNTCASHGGAAPRTPRGQRHEPLADHGGQPRFRDHDDRLAAGRTKDEQAAVGAGEANDAPEGAVEPGLERGRGGERPQEVGEDIH